MYSEVSLNEHLNNFRGGLFNVKYKLYCSLGSLCFLRDFLLSLIVALAIIICCTMVAIVTVSYRTYTIITLGLDIH